jgi:hypothetical protein
VDTRSSGAAVSLWRDYDDEVRALPGMSLGVDRAPGPATRRAKEIFELGARRADLMEIVDMPAEAGGLATVAALALVRELTAWGVFVGWRVRLGSPDDWLPLSHLWPPTQVAGVPEPGQIAAAWAGDFFLGKCLYRQGCNFIEVRDRRQGVLERLTIDEPSHLAVVSQLLDGASVSLLPERVLADLEAEHLVGRVGDTAWWLPYRVRRWPHPAFRV